MDNTFAHEIIKLCLKNFDYFANFTYIPISISTTDLRFWTCRSKELFLEYDPATPTYFTL
jgi:hypothetical protein